MRRSILSTLPWGLTLVLVVVAAIFVYAPSPSCSEVQEAGAGGAMRLQTAIAEPGEATVEATLLVPSFLFALNHCTGGLPAASFGQRAWLRNVADGNAIDAGVIAMTHLGSDTGGALRLDLTQAEPIAAGAVAVAPAMLRAEEITQAGKYKGDLILLPGVDGSPTITVTVLVQDLFLWPLLALIAGAWLAWALLRRADQERPRELLRAELRGAGETYKRFRREQSACPYELEKAFPPGNRWQATASSGYLAEKLLSEIHQAHSQIELDQASERVADLAELVALLPKLCSRRAELADLVPIMSTAENEVLEHHPDLLPDLMPPSPIQKATEVLLANKPELSGADDAAAFLTRLRQQADAVDTWLQGWRYLDPVLVSWKKATLLPRQDRQELDKLAAPAAIATVHLWPADGWAKVRKAAVVDQLKVVHLAAESALRRAHGQPIPVAVDLSAPAGLPGRRTETRTGAQILAAVEARDILEFVITFLITTFAFLLTLYVGKNFGGSPWDYVTALVAGATGQVAINWKLLPWYRSYTSARGPAV